MTAASLKRYPHRHDKNDDSSRAERRNLRRETLAALAHTNGVLLEIAGPTPGGFAALGKSKLPNGIVISNFEPTEGASQIVDARNIPYPAHSIGGIAVSALTIMPEEIAKSKVETVAGFDPGVLKNLGNMIVLLGCEEDKSYSRWNDPEILSYSQRLAMLREARLKLQPGGVLLVKQMLGGELRLAEQLGFLLKATTVKDINIKADEPNTGEFLFVLNDLDTPAGLAIEASNST
ncbi:MAG TPA: hypothetical protein VGE13_00230 [Candidatus Saccharimonadales bacterium]